MNLLIAATALSLLVGPGARASANANLDQAGSIPAWLNRDIQRNASWLPAEIKRAGLNQAYRNRWASFPSDVQSILVQMKIPYWQIALVPSASEKQSEIIKQFRFMGQLAGAVPSSPVAQRVEQLLIFGGAAQLPTPGDNQNGKKSRGGRLHGGDGEICHRAT